MRVAATQRWMPTIKRSLQIITAVLVLVFMAATIRQLMMLRSTAVADAERQMARLDMVFAEQTGRACHAIEIAPAYVDVAVKRWQAFTGLEAKLDGDGRSFEEIALERAAQDRRPEPASRVWGPG